MHTNAYRALLNRLNKNASDKMVFYKAIAANVDYGIGWFPGSVSKKGLTPSDGPYRLYLIKHQDGQYVGLVLDASSFDLHYYTLPAYRGQSHLSNALRNYILPHIFSVLKRKIQHITINPSRLGPKGYSSSRHLAAAVGFKFTGTDNGIDQFSLNAAGFKNFIPESVPLIPMPHERAQEIQQTIKLHTTELKKVLSEFEVKFGVNRHLSNVIKNLNDLTIDMSSTILDAYEKGLIIST
jgi:hypothetical protein